MLKKIVTGSFILIGIYLFVDHETAGGALITDGGNTASGFVKALQGR